jgi:hypothetical protein
MPSQDVPEVRDGGASWAHAKGASDEGLKENNLGEDQRGAGSHLRAVQRPVHEGSEWQSDGVPQVPHMVLLLLSEAHSKRSSFCVILDMERQNDARRLTRLHQSRNFNKTIVLERKVGMQTLFNARKEDPDRPDDAPDDGDRI